MRFIEIIGPPAVGKSEIISALPRGTGGSSVWAMEAAILSRLRGPSMSPRGWIRWMMNRAIGRPQGQLFGPALNEYVMRNQAFLKLCWRLIDVHRGHAVHPVDSRLAAAAYMWSSLSRLSNLVAHDDDRLAIVDEGLLQRLVSLWSPSISRADVEAYVDLMPRPAGVVACRATKEVVRARARTRTRLATNHLGMSDDDLLRFTDGSHALTQLLQDVLVARGVAVLAVDTEFRVGENATKISEFLRHLK